MTPMVVQCSSCLTEFELDPNKVPAAGVRARCSVCSAVITVPPPPAAAPTAPEAKAPIAEARPVREDAASHGGASFRKESYSPAPQPTAQPTAQPTTQAPSLEQSGWTAPRPSSAAFATPSPAAKAPAAQPENEAAQRRPINPFLTRDPALRAKRLARALVSDIVAYHPARHAEGLRDGTLKTLFRDEIKKSYEEYVDQVGRDFAGSTTHFQDALNDVLASGKKLF
jgi:predicted Zn finger-like uncharacterized protein